MVRPIVIIVVTVIVISPFAAMGVGQSCLVATTVRVLDRQGQPLANLTADQFRAEIGDSPATVTSLSPDKPRLIILLDISSSMKGIWTPSIAAAKQLIGMAGEDGDVVLFRDKIRGVARGRSEGEKLLDRLSADVLQPGGTALYDTLIEVAGRVKTRSVAIVVISDGEDDASDHTADATASLLARSSSPPIFAIVLDYDREHARSRGYFKRIPTETGGLVDYPSSASKVPEATASLATNVLTSFTLNLQAPQPITKTVKLKVEITDPDGKPRRDVHVLHVTAVTGCDGALTKPETQK